jgi:Putative Actinobacterial Holin-X, holin superfamily III
VIDAIFVDGVGDIWLGFAIVAAVLVLLTAATFLFAWKKLQVGPPTPQMAIDEAKKIRDTMSSPTTTLPASSNPPVQVR